MFRVDLVFSRPLVSKPPGVYERSRLVAPSQRHLGIVHPWRWRRRLQLGLTGEHLAHADAHTLDDGEEDGAPDGAVADGPGPATHGEGAARHAAGDDSVPWVLLLADALDGAV